MRASALVAAVLVATVAVAGASATTGVEQVIPVKVILTDRGVSFSHHLKPTTETTIAVSVLNRSSKPRWFKIGWRKTHSIERGGRENFYFSFAVPGKVTWTSGGSGGKTFAGRIPVKLGTIYGNNG